MTDFFIVAAIINIIIVSYFIGYAIGRHNMNKKWETVINELQVAAKKREDSESRDS